IVYEDERSLGVLDINPRAPGHTMIIPKVHAETVLDLPDDYGAFIFQALKNMTEKLHQAFAPDGFTIGINHGRTAGQAIDHLHIHIIPRYKNDGGSSVHGVVQNPPKESLAKIRNKILNGSRN
ncbi:MAG: HIT family protein, partial [Patescibacteria group bacterium]